MVDGYLKSFLDTLQLEGYSDGTITIYRNTISNMLGTLNKSSINATTADIRKYLSDYKETHNISNVTLNNYQRYISSFYKWLLKEEIIEKNPCENLRAIKVPRVIKDGFTDVELEDIRLACRSVRDSALVEVLYSTGMRASELIGLNRSDIDWVNKKTIVFGKGKKEREVYFSSRSLDFLKQYLDSRTDDDEALFVTSMKPYHRITIDSLENTLRTIGKKCGIHVHPHRFRHTCATVLLANGMPIQEVSEILGHARIDTTMIYCTLNKKQIADDYDKFMQD